VQALLPQDFEARLQFCRWICEANNRDVQFIKNILFTDEATFTRNGMTNIHNTHIWAEENPKAIVETHHQVHFKFNVWADVVDNFLLGPVILPGNLTGDSFLEFLENNLPDLLVDVPLQVRQNMWFQLDNGKKILKYLENYDLIHFFKIQKIKENDYFTTQNMCQVHRRTSEKNEGV
jgi:hypothetical protein